MEQAGTFFGRAGEVATSSARWIVLFGRKYPLAAAGYLVFFVWFFFQQINQSSLPPAPPLPQSSTFPAPSPLPLPSPVVSVAQAQAFKSGDNITVRWSQTVQNPQLYADGSLLSPTCQGRICTVSISTQINELQASWQEGGQSFKKKFRF